MKVLVIYEIPTGLCVRDLTKKGILAYTVSFGEWFLLNLFIYLRHFEPERNCSSPSSMQVLETTADVSNFVANMNYKLMII